MWRTNFDRKRYRDVLLQHSQRSTSDPLPHLCDIPPRAPHGHVHRSQPTVIQVSPVSPPSIETQWIVSVLNWEKNTRFHSRLLFFHVPPRHTNSFLFTDQASRDKHDVVQSSGRRGQPKSPWQQGKVTSKRKSAQLQQNKKSSLSLIYLLLSFSLPTLWSASNSNIVRPGMPILPLDGSGHQCRSMVYVSVSCFNSHRTMLVLSTCRPV